MRRYRWWLSCLLVAAFAAAPALAQDAGGKKKKKERAAKKERPAKKERKPKGDRRRKGGGGLAGQIAKVCQLSEQQQADLQEALKAYTAAQKEARERQGELRKAMAEARKAKDKDKFKELAQQQKALMGPANDALAKAMGVLTPEQRAKWEGSKLARQVLGRLKKAELDDAQKKAVEALCTKKAQELKDSDEKTKRSASRTVLQEVVDNILTADQKAKVNTRKPGAGKKPRDKGPKKPGEKGARKGKKKGGGDR